LPVLIGISLLTTLRTFLIVITEDDCHSIFEGRSPLSPEVLA
jgi:hypothetical protein